MHRRIDRYLSVSSPGGIQRRFSGTSSGDHASQPGVEDKKMFGGVTFMVAGQMCCGVLKDDLVLRVGSEHFHEALANPHVRAFDFSGRPMIGMVYVASAGVSDDEALRACVRRGLDYVLQHPKESKRSGGRKTVRTESA
jgi:TfoX/Sxy family transcriptional regulator of competence genes